MKKSTLYFILGIVGFGISLVGTLPGAHANIITGIQLSYALLALIIGLPIFFVFGCLWSLPWSIRMNRYFLKRILEDDKKSTNSSRHDQ